MGTGIGMRGKDLQKFLQVAKEFNVIILVRHTNADSLKYIGKAGYYPKPALCKAKTADKNPPAFTTLVQGRKQTFQPEIAGLVVHPGFHPYAYEPKKVAKAASEWLHTLELIAPSLKAAKVDLADPASWSIWGVERKAASAPRWSWRVDIDPKSPHFGCLQLKNEHISWSYVHGDYDLKDVIVEGRRSDNRTWKSRLDGVPNNTPLLADRRFSTIQSRLNSLIGADMVQHGAEAQFAWHGADDPITAAFPDWTHKLFYDAVTVQLWYREINRNVLAKEGKDYTTDPRFITYLGAGDKWWENKPGA